MVKKSAEVLRLHNRVPFEWDSTYQVCRVLQTEIAHAMQHGKKLNKMAEDVKMSSTTISRIGYGVTKEPRATTVVSLLKYFNYKITVS